MRVPLSWLREYVDVPADNTGREVAERLIRAGFEVESVDSVGAGVVGPVVSGRVLEIDEFTASNGKTVRYCRVDVGAHNSVSDPATSGSRGIVCGARNFVIGDAVVVALPGSVLPGGFAISGRKTYGHLSDGMICSVRELELGDDHAGILVLADAPPPGTDLLPLLALQDEVLAVDITPDRGYAMSIRGLARELATSYGIGFRDPTDRQVPPAGAGGHPVVLMSPRCDRFVARTVTGLDPSAPSPLWLQTRLYRAGQRPISLAVDVTNYVMLETGQPLHAYDAGALNGPIEVRDAAAGQTLRTLDGALRTLLADDLVIADGSGPIGLAGVMGGASTEIGAATTDIVVEAAHFDPHAVGVTSRRLALGSEASRRFERGVDPRVPAAAADRAVELLVSLGGGSDAGGGTDVDRVPPMTDVIMAADLPDRVAGMTYGLAVVTARLEDVGCVVRERQPDSGPAADGSTALLAVTPPTWRPDLRDPNDLVEEVIRLEGYESVPSVLPATPPGRGLTAAQRLHRRVGRALAGAGFVEVLTNPFIGPVVLDAFGLDGRDPRRRVVTVFNPLSDEEPWLRTTLLAGLVGAARRNIGRGSNDLALFELGSVFLATGSAAGPPVHAPVPRPPVDRAPTAKELSELEALLPEQPWHAAVLLTGAPWPDGPWGAGRVATWSDAVEAVRTLARAAGTHIEVRSAEQPPWHPGRCAEVLVHGATIGWAGELHPRVLAALELPPRTCAAEIDLDAVSAAAAPVVRANAFSKFPPALRDLALVVASDVPAVEVTDAIRDGAGALLEGLRLFDVYTGSQLAADRRSLAFRLRLRAPDRTLTAEDVSVAVDAAVAEAHRRTGAVLRT